jgi:arsenate reductase (glutaredoxin)
MKILHNPRCGKSREALKILEEQNVNPVIVKYMEEPLSKEELSELIAKLGVSPIDLVRKNERVWKESYKGRDLNEEEVIQAMADHPILMERPIVIQGQKAVIGRPPERVKELL